MVWYSISLRIFHSVITQCDCVIHTVRGFSVVNEAEVDVFLEFPCFFYDSADTSSLISGFSAFSLVPLPFINPAYTSGSSWFMYC